MNYVKDLMQRIHFLEDVIFYMAGDLQRILGVQFPEMDASELIQQYENAAREPTVFERVLMSEGTQVATGVHRKPLVNMMVESVRNICLEHEKRQGADKK